MKKWMMAIVAATALLLTGCKTVYVPVETFRTDTLKVAHIVTDSVYVEQRDSTAMHTNGDTVTIERWHWRDRWRDRVTHDTIYKSRTDSVTVAVPAADAGGSSGLTRWQRWRMNVGNVVLVVLGVMIAYAIGRFIYRIKG